MGCMGPMKGCFPFIFCRLVHLVHRGKEMVHMTYKIPQPTYDFAYLCPKNKNKKKRQFLPHML